MLIRYSTWDGSQNPLAADADDLMDAMSDDLLADGDLMRALQRLFRRGFQNRQDQRVPGLNDLLERLRQRRQQLLDRHDLSGIMQELTERLQRVKRTEQEGIRKRLEEGRQKAAAEDVPEGLQKALEKMAAEKQEYLDELPADPASQIAKLSDYEFMDQDARAQFQELLDMLQQQVLQSYFQGMQQAIQGLSPQDLARAREMIRDLNQVLRQRMQGQEPDFDEFMRKHGEFFPGAKSLDELLDRLRRQMAMMQSLLDSMSPEQRDQLRQMMDSVLRDDRLRAELAQLAGNLQQLMPWEDLSRSYPFRGDDPLTLQEAMKMMQDLQELERLEQQLKGAQQGSDLDQVETQALQKALGDEAAETLEHLRQLTKLLEEAGYVQQKGSRLTLTARAVRKIGQKALSDIFDRLKQDRIGKHAAERRGFGGERTEDTKRYEFGDPFLLDVKTTVFNAAQRQSHVSASPSEAQTRAPGPRALDLRLEPQDFEVFRTELLTQAATVVLVDMSRSMILRGCFLAAKKVALALDALIRGQFPRDDLFIVGFSRFAVRLKPESLPALTWNEWNYGTNMQHGFMLARQLLNRTHSTNKQVIVITDGEPTAYFEGGHIEFSYPPTYRCYEETLREVQRCTRDRITINTFMLERGYSLVNFVEQMARINRGRAFFATPERLGDYILVDYVNLKRQSVRHRSA